MGRTGRTHLATLALATAAILAAGAARAAERVAVIIGNGNYLQGPLPNPVHDAASVAAALTDLGFRAEIIANAGTAQMHEDVLRAIAAARGAEIFVLYYAGHGVQANGVNYLLPVDLTVRSQDDVRLKALPLNSIVDTMGRADIGTGLVFLDACRNNPLADKGVVPRGLAFFEKSKGEMVISYAAAAGAVAYDGVGSNSPYSLALTEALEEPGLDIYAVMRQVRRRVREITEGRQIPWVSGSVEREIVLNQDSDPAFREAASFDPADPNWLDDTSWQSIAGRSNATLFAQFLRDFPTSRYAPAARARLAELSAADRRPPILADPLAPVVPTATGAPLVDPMAAGITSCDLLAAGDRDPWRLVQGVPPHRLNTQEAILACARDLAAHPNQPRLLFELARALRYAERWPEALHYAGLAAERDYPEAYSTLASLHAQGLGVELDPRRAVALWRRGAELGSPNARANLGRSYRDGFGVDRSLPDAVHWMSLAASAGEMIAADDLGNLYRRGQEGIPADLPRARDWYQLGASLGSSNAMANLGTLYRDGDGVGRDPDIAKYWFRRASDAGNRYAPFHLARLLLAEDAKAHRAEALDLFLLAGNRGFPEGFTRVAQIYGGGKGGRDAEQAYFYARLALGSGDEKAAGVLKTLGDKVEPATIQAASEKAERWLAQNGDSLRMSRFAK